MMSGLQEVDVSHSVKSATGPDSVVLDDAAVARAVDLQLLGMIAQRMRVGGAVLGISSLLWLLVDYFTVGMLSSGLVAVQLLLVLVGLFVGLAGEKTWLRRWAVPVALTFAGLVCVGITLQSILRAEPGTALLMFAVFSVGASALIPWGTAAQALIASFTLVGLLSALRVTNVTIVETFGFGDLMGLFVALGYSVFVAYQLRLYRAETLAETMKLRHSREVLRRSESHVRSLNLELEQRVLERTGDLNEALEEMRVLTSAVSHDLRPPLRTVNGLLAILEEGSGGRLSEEEAEYIDRSRQAVVNMGLMIDDFLSLSRLRTARFAPEQIDVSALAERIVGVLQDDDSQRELKVDIEPGLTVFADTWLLTVLLQNLLENAWKFTGPKTDARIEFGYDAELLPTPAFFVRDNGIGFDMAHSSQLFGTFQRLIPNDQFEGTGIGLATATRIVRRHGGQIWAEGEPDVGAVFYFTLNTRPTA